MWLRLFIRSFRTDRIDEATEQEGGGVVGFWIFFFLNEMYLPSGQGGRG